MTYPLAGINYLLNGFALIFKPGVRRFIVIPLVINTLLFIGFFFIFRHYVAEFNLWFANFLPGWLHWLSAILWVLFLISFFLFFIYAFVTFANIISAPFNSLLAEKVEFFLTGKTLESRSLFENIKDIPRIVGRQLAILGYYLPRALGLLILFFIPVIHIIMPIVWFLFTAWYMTLTYIDYPTDNHRIPLNEVREWLKQKRWTALLFGISILVVTMIPVVNLFAIPAAVAAATQFWIEEAKI